MAAQHQALLIHPGPKQVHLFTYNLQTAADTLRLQACYVDTEHKTVKAMSKQKWHHKYNLHILIK